MKAWPILLAAALPLAVLATHPQLPTAAVKISAKSGPTLIQPGEIKWQEVPDLGPGVQVAVLRGNPDKLGNHFTTRVKWPDGHRVAPHWHPADESFAVLQGNFRIGIGDKWDDAKLTDLPQGGFATLPKGVRHFALAKGETVLELSGVGPFKTIWVDPPKKK